MSRHMRTRLRDVLAWARANDWRPLRAGNRHAGMYSWTNEVPDPGNRQQSTIQVFIDTGVGWLEIRQRMATGWHRIAQISFGAWQAPLDVLAALCVIPQEHSTAWRDSRRQALRELSAHDSTPRREQSTRKEAHHGHI